MTERDLYIPFRKTLEKIRPVESACYELKIVKSKRFALSSVHPHQTEALLAVSHGHYVRIADQPFVQGGFQQRKSFDCVWFNGIVGYVVPVFYVPRKRKTAYLIPVKEFLKFEGKSVTEEELSRFVSVEL